MWRIPRAQTDTTPMTQPMTPNRSTISVLMIQRSATRPTKGHACNQSTLAGLDAGHGLRTLTLRMSYRSLTPSARKNIGYAGLYVFDVLLRPGRGYASFV